MMKCREATQLLSEKMDRPLTAKEKLSVNLHTAICPACRQFGKQMLTLRQIAKAYVHHQDKDQ